MQTLLDELETLTFDGRMARMAELGRTSLTDPGLRETLAAWEHGEWFERFLALQACYGSRNGAHVLRALGDPSRTVRGRALGLVPHVCDDDQALAALRILPDRWLPSLLRRLSGGRRREVVDRFLAELVENRDPRLGRYLAYGTAEFVRNHLPAVAEAASDRDWRRLIRHHPVAAAGSLHALSAASPAPDARLRWQANAVLPWLGRFHPELGLSLAQSLLRHAAPSQLELQTLLARRPHAVVDLLMAAVSKPKLDFAPLAHRLDAARLRGLLERYPDLLLPRAAWFRRLHPEARLEIYQAMALRWRDPQARLPRELVALIPIQARELEARRHLALPALPTCETRLSYAAFLPWEEAEAELIPFLRHPEAELRATAISTLIEAAGYHRSRLPGVLERVRERSYDQDLVRVAMLNALADLPPGVWRQEHLEALGGIVRAALDAANLSTNAAQPLERLLVALIPFHGPWAAEWLATLIRERGWVQRSTPWARSLDARISERDWVVAAQWLMPVFRGWRNQGRREWAVLHAATSVKRYLWAVPALPALVTEIMESTRDHRLAGEALELLTQSPGERQRQRHLIQSLLTQDPSWITHVPVYEYLHRVRQDWLGPFLGQESVGGRFYEANRIFVLPVRGGFHRWTPSQQRRFAETLRRVIEIPGQPTSIALACVARLAELPAVAPDFLLQLIAADNPRPAVREAALKALGRLDTSGGLSALTGALETDAARTAIYALKIVLQELPTAETLFRLRAVPRGRITVAKEVTRQIGELPGEDAYQTLLALDREALHRDVRRALLRALWSHLERDDTWPVLERAASSPDATLAVSLAALPVDRLSPTTGRRLCALLAGLLEHPDPSVPATVLRRAQCSPLHDPERVLLEPVLQHLRSSLSELRYTASHALLTIYQDGDAARVAEAVSGILEDRRAVDQLVTDLSHTLTWEGGHKLSFARALLDVLAADPLLAEQRLTLAILGLPWREAGDLIEQHAADDTLHAEALMAVIGTLGGLAHRPDLPEVAELETRFSAHSDPRLRRVALTALVAAARCSGWTPYRLECLERYRRDPVPLVAAAAQFTFPPEAPAGRPPSGQFPIFKDDDE